MIPDFGAFPPEVTSTLVYTGPGAAPLMSAAASWDSLNAQLNSFALDYSSAVSELQDTAWSGPAASAMAAAAEPYLAWVTTTATLTAQAANQARAAAAAYDAALAAVVPPALVEANRARRAILVAANIFAQNAATIAALDAGYLRMWAQDAAAMYGYAASSSVATALAPFSEPPQTTSAAGQASTSATETAATSPLSQAISLVPQQLGALSTAGTSDSATPDLSSMLTEAGQLNTLTGPAGFAEANARTATSAGSFFSGIYRSILQSQGAISKALPELGPATTAAPVLGDAAGPSSAVLAGIGRAEPIGGLSVPQQWAAATPTPTTFAEPPWLSEVELAEASSWGPTPASASALPGTEPMAGMGPMAAPGATPAAGRPSVNSILRVGPRRFSMPRPAVGG